RIDHLPLHEKTWNQCLKFIEGRVNNQSFNTWFKPIVPLRMTDRNFVIQVPSQFFSDWLDEHHYTLLVEALRDVTGLETEIDYEIVAEERDLRPVLPHASQSSPEPQRLLSSASVDTATDEVKKPPPVPFLNPRYTFQNYIKGESNQFACAAALA